MRIRNKRNSQPDQIPNPASEPNPFPVNFDDIQEGFERIGFDWKYLYLNDAAASRYGRTRESLLGCTIFEAVPVEQKSLLYNQLSVCMEQRIPNRFGFSISSADGGKQWYQYSAYPSAEGIFIFSTSSGDPERQESEPEAPHEGEQKYRTLFNSIDEGCCIIEIIFDEGGKAVDYRFLDVNASFERQTGIRDAVGKRIREIAPQNEEHWYRTYGRVALTGEPVRFQSFSAELRRWYDVFAFRYGKPGDNQVALLFSDITGRKKVEEELRLENERFLRFLNSNIIGIVIADSDSKIIFANDYYLNILGATWDDFPGGKVDWRKYTPPEWLPADEKALRELDERGVCEPYEKEYMRADGTRVPVYIADAILPGPRKQIAGFVLDITGRKQAEEELRRTRDRQTELSHRLANAYETTTRAIGRELHDEMGQMLTVLKLSLGMLSDLPPETAAQKLAQSKKIVDDLMARTSALSLKLRSPILDDFGLLPALVWHINRFQEQSSVAVEFRHTGIEGRRFEQQIEYTAYRLVQEALTNVARHAHGTRAWLEIHVKDQELELTVRDDGVGFDPAAALEKNRGLSSMVERVGLVNGTLQVDSEPERGTRISIRLPL